MILEQPSRRKLHGHPRLRLANRRKNSPGMNATKMIRVLIAWVFFSVGFSATCFVGVPTCYAQEGQPLLLGGSQSEVGSKSVQANARVTLQQAESLFAAAIGCEANRQEQCVDLYFQAAASAWWLSQSQIMLRGKMCGRAEQIYQISLSKLISTGQQFGRLNPKTGLNVYVNGGWQWIPVQHSGFVWNAADFDNLIPMSSGGSKELKRAYRCEGLGVSAIVHRCGKDGESFRKRKQTFCATAILHPVGIGSGVPGQFVLELLDPLRIKSVDVAGRQVAIVRDISAAIVYVMKNKTTNPFKAFLHPGATTADSKLFMLEPFQPGKIPLVFVHGLLSDPYVWANMANEMFARPDLLERYQIWGFEYATGEPFLSSAADMRDELWRAEAVFGTDPAFSQMVLVGHSMGGLISKLQITHSGDQLWQAVSRCDIPSIATTDSTRRSLERAFYFGPSNNVAKVIYMGTPHRGSPWARRAIGRIGAKLVEETSSMEAQHQSLISSNPGNFSREFMRRIPTSVDLLRSDSQLLMAMDQLYVANHVQEHSIIGLHRRLLGSGPSDGVVPVSSALRQGVQSQTLIRARHVDIPDKQEAVEELVRILRQHTAGTIIKSE